MGEQIVHTKWTTLHQIFTALMSLSNWQQRERERGAQQEGREDEEQKHMACSPFLSTFFSHSFHYSLFHKYRLHIKASPSVPCLIIQRGFRERTSGRWLQNESLSLNLCTVALLQAHIFLILLLSTLIICLNIILINYSNLLYLWTFVSFYFTLFIYFYFFIHHAFIYLFTAFALFLINFYFTYLAQQYLLCQWSMLK